MSNDTEVEILAFNKRIIYNNQIVEYILAEKTLFGVKYNLIGVINTPQSNHYNGVVINLNKKYLSLDIGKNYIYDRNVNEGEILIIENLIDTLIKNNPYVGIYVKS